MVLVAVVLAVTAMVYLLGVVGTKETSFEDALAEQRNRQKEEQAGKGKKNKASCVRQ